MPKGYVTVAPDLRTAEQKRADIIRARNETGQWHGSDNADQELPSFNALTGSGHAVPNSQNTELSAFGSELMSDNQAQRELGFDSSYYLSTNKNVADAATSAGVDLATFAYQHYQTFGWHEGRDPNKIFDTKSYLSTYSDVAAAGVDPLSHYLNYGWQEGRDPSGQFDTSSYLAAYGDVNGVGVNPMSHYIAYGASEGRSTFADGVVDVAVGNGAGGRPRVGAFEGPNHGQLKDTFPYSMSGGINVAPTDSNLGGQIDVVVVQGPDRGAPVGLYEGTKSVLVGNFLALENIRSSFYAEISDSKHESSINLLSGGGAKSNMSDISSMYQLGYFIE